MMDHTDKGYYRCKVAQDFLYKECKTAFVKYINPETLTMLQHNFSTKKKIP